MQKITSTKKINKKEEKTAGLILEADVK